MQKRDGKYLIRAAILVAAWLTINSPALSACPADADGDGVCDGVDICPNTVPGSPVDAKGCPPAIPGDFNRDGDVDLDDLTLMNACRTGPAIPLYGAPACQQMDFDHDTDVDMDDFAVFQRCFSGANHPGSPDCQFHSARISNGCLRINGTAASSQLALRLKAGAPTILQVDVGNDGVADFSFDRALFSCIVVNAGGGDDLVRIDEINGIFTDTELTTINGEDGNDTLIGGSGAETFSGGSGNDTIDGNRGNDVAFMGADNDTFIWDPGDGSDIIEGQEGADALVFNGANAAENIILSANGGRLRFLRDVASITMDTNDVERVDFQALGGVDNIVINNLAGTDVTEVNVNLAGTLGGNTGDAQADNVFVNATNGIDKVVITGGGTSTTIAGLSAVVKITTSEVANDRLTVNALSGDDNVQASGLPAGVIALTLSGGIGNDVLVGSHGGDLLNGDEDNDTITGGSGDDVVQLGTGNDRFIWNPGDGTDTIEGNDGSDTIEVNGGNGAEDFTITANGTRVRFDRVNPAPFFLDIGTSENLVLNANGGNDTLNCTGNLAPLIQITTDGGPGDDILNGSNGADTLLGGDDNDTIDGNQGNDVALMGAGNDTFRWDPGDGSDTVEGQAGTDTLVFNGANINEKINISANGSRLRFTRDVANITMDLNDVERVNFQALGGADTITVNDLTGTDAKEVNLDLAVPIGGNTGDGQADNVIVDGTNGVDNVVVTGSGSSASVSGLAAVVNIGTAEVANDRLTVNALGGNDNLQASGLPAGVIALTFNGGVGNDVLVGSHGDDLLNGNEDNDSVTGGSGNDLAQLGTGNDRFIWNPGDGTDTIEGNDGSDTIEVNGGNGAEDFTITANGTRVRFDRINPAPFFLDLGTSENLVLNANGGNDTLNCTGNLAALIQITADGGPGDDTLNGSNGADTLLGGDDNDTIDGNQGNDVALMGAGNDTFRWDPGDGSDTVEGQAGTDALIFNGANINENINISANGSRLRFTRDIANITMDVNGVEHVNFQALGGADSITVNDLTGTDVTQVNLNLLTSVGSGDGSADTVTINATSGADTVTVSGAAGNASVVGLAAQVAILGSEPGNDRLFINLLAGDDVMDASGLAVGVIQLTVNGGDNDDVLIGSDWDDTLQGGAGDDVLIGGPGNDILDGGPGSNVVIQ